MFCRFDKSFSFCNKFIGAFALIKGKSGSDVQGRVDFVQSESGLQVIYDLNHLPKNKTLGFHIHEIGNCSSKDAKSAGKHFMKMTESGGGTSKDFPEKYAGDLPSISTDASGKSKGTFTVANLSINSMNSIKDRAVIIHSGPDDPNQKSAPRIGCGVIKNRR